MAGRGQCGGEGQVDVWRWMERIHGINWHIIGSHVTGAQNEPGKHFNWVIDSVKAWRARKESRIKKNRIHLKNIYDHLWLE